MRQARLDEESVRKREGGATKQQDMRKARWMKGVREKQQNRRT
jgi:hypothetical protein